MTTPTFTPELTSEAVAAAWLASEGTLGSVATTLPSDPLTWSEYSSYRIFLQTTDAGSDLDPYTRLTTARIQCDAWAVKPTSNRPAWAAAGSLATAVARATFAGGRIARVVTVPDGYGRVRVIAARPLSAPRRIPDDPSGYARYTLDLELGWIPLSTP